MNAQTSFTIFSSVLFHFQSPVKTLEKDAATITNLFHITSIHKGKLEQENKDNYVGNTAEVYVMNLNSTKIHKFVRYWLLAPRIHD
jgi:hypothetical protein